MDFDCELVVCDVRFNGGHPDIATLITFLALTPGDADA